MMKKYPYYDAPRFSGYREMLVSLSQRHSDKLAVSFYGRDGEKRSQSYAQILKHAQAAAEFIFKTGKKRAAIAARNSFEWISAYFGVICAGGCPILIDTEQPAETINAMLETAGAELVLADSETRGVITYCAGIIDIYALPQEGAFPEVSEGDEVIAFTSGTTGKPKAVRLGVAGLLQNASEALMMADPGKRVFSPLPLFHIYGLNSALIPALLCGAEIALSEDVRTVMRDMRLFEPETVMTVPLIAEIMIRELEKSGAPGEGKKKGLFGKKSTAPSEAAIKAKNDCFPKLSLVICGGAPAAESMARRMEAFGITFLQGYGITECSPLVSVNRNGCRELSSVGLPLPSFGVRIVEGEIWLSGPCVMKGYLGGEEEKGWFKTGDTGHIDKHGFLHINGRIKNIIVMKNGKKTSPEEIERYLRELPLVKSVRVYGSPSDTDDVKIAATVYPDEKESTGRSNYELLAELQRGVDEINKKLPLYKHIQILTLSEKELETTALNKEKR